jgi:hypothetical protein
MTSENHCENCVRGRNEDSITNYCEYCKWFNNLEDNFKAKYEPIPEPEPKHEEYDHIFTCPFCKAIVQVKDGKPEKKEEKEVYYEICGVCGCKEYIGHWHKHDEKEEKIEKLTLEREMIGGNKLIRDTINQLIDAVEDLRNR